MQILADLLRDLRQYDLMVLAEDALAGNEQTLNSFLVSNELWGGEGSIADQAGVAGIDRTSRRKAEHVLIALGRSPISLGIVNLRTQMWVDAFIRLEQADL